MLYGKNSSVKKNFDLISTDINTFISTKSMKKNSNQKPKWCYKNSNTLV